MARERPMSPNKIISYESRRSSVEITVQRLRHLLNLTAKKRRIEIRMARVGFTDRQR